MILQILEATSEMKAIIAMAVSQGKFNSEFFNKLQYDDNFYDERKEQFYKYSGHGTLLEYIDITFFLNDVSRNALDDLARHRMSSLTIQSTRNKSIKKNENILSSYYKDYFELKPNWSESMILGDFPKQRDKWNGILPLGTSSQAIFKINLRSLVNMAGQRMCFRAREELRIIMNELKKQLKEGGLAYYKLLVPKCKQVGYCTEADEDCCGYSVKKSKAKDYLNRMNEVKDELNNG